MFGVPKNGQMNYAMLLLPKHCKTDRPTKQLQIRGPFFSAWQQNKTFYPLSHTVIARSAFMCVLVSMHMAPLSLRTSSLLITHWQQSKQERRRRRERHAEIGGCLPRPLQARNEFPTG